MRGRRALPVLTFGLREPSLEDALRVGPALAAHEALRSEGVLFASSLVSARASVVLGAHQRRVSVLDERACREAGVAVFRRATAGNAARVEGRAVLFSMALAAVNALAPDATPPTLTNRVVRGFLQAFTRIGAHATFAGRDWVALAKRPGALLSLEQWEDGVTLVELLVGLDAPFAVPDAWCTQDERARSGRRMRGLEPAGLGELTRRRVEPDELARAVQEAHGERWGRVVRATDEPLVLAPGRARSPHAGDVVGERDAEWPFADRGTRSQVRAELEIPAGLLEGARDERGTLRLAGALLAPTYLMRAFEHAASAREPDAPTGLLAQAPLEGARAVDLWELLTGLRDAAP